MTQVILTYTPWYAILAIEAEARQQALSDAIAAVEGLIEHYGPQSPSLSYAVIDTLTRLRDGS